MPTSLSLDGLPASRELDALVAEKVMGWKRHGEHTWDMMPETNPGCCLYTDAALPHFSTSIAAAWEVVQHFFNTGYTVVLFAYSETHPVRRKPEVESYCCEMHHPEQRIAFGRADTAPLSICRAALKAVGC